MGTRVAVLGAGSWGTALAIHLAGNGHAVTLWGHLPEEMATLARERANPYYLPGIPFPETLTPTADLESALAADTWLVVVPSHAFRAVLARIAPALRPQTHLGWGTKGLERASGRLLHEVAEEVLGPRVVPAVLSGPTFAGEVARGLPTAITVAARRLEAAEHFASLLRGRAFRAYTTDDVVGVSLGGAVKNVLAIAAGISDGLGFGANARAALITRGLAEMMRLGLAMGGRRETFMGLAGVGDLVLTCTDDQSRNRRLGLALGRGKTREAAAAEIGQVIEGAEAAREVHRLGQAHRVELPICEEVYRVLYEGRAPLDAVRALLAREPKPEPEPVRVLQEGQR
ncbi:MAG: NAD(P)-dependent glycerol-3-phosphate dehydrogenase [Gammaproteobacteria bacterium]|nr:MAG: NAD(P)-dependent glycerol-3-phosphate dehydrogenase [Gammaproteobacteria bacterium]